MCDLPEEELAEHLLWLEYAESRVKTAATSPRARATAPLPGAESPTPVAASA